MEDSSLPDSSYAGERFRPSQSYHKSSGRPKRFILIIFVLLVIGAGVFGIMKLSGSSVKKEEKLSVTPSPTEIEFPTDTPSPTAGSSSPTPRATVSPTAKPAGSSIDKASGLDRSQLSVEIKNGSGQVGAASKAADALKELGYHIISTGNADSFDYEKTTIEVKSSKNSYLALLKKDLSTYTIGSSSATLSSSSSADAVVIVGKE